MGKQRIKPPAGKQGHRIQAPDVTNYDDRPPIFSLERIQDGEYSFDRLNRLAFRFSGRKPMAGYRIDNVFHVLWFDRDFTLYGH